MAEAYIVGAVRTPIGTRKGALAAVHPADLGAHVLKELVNRTGIDPAAVEDVIMGCVTQVGPQALDLARTAWLSAGLPESTPGVTIDRQCGSSQQAVHFAAQGVMSGTQDLVIAAGVENMGMVPMGANVQFAVDNGLSVYGQGWVERYGTQEISQFRGAQLMCEKWGYTREDLEKYALESHRRAAAAIEAGYFDAETAPLAGVTHDEGVRPDTSLEKMAELAPLREGWALTAAVSSQISVGASALLIASERAVAEHGLTPLARIVQLALAGDDPVYMLTAPIPATRIALRKAGLDIDDIDVVEINEAFAPVPMAWIDEIGADPAKVNPNGGAIALGHPLGATGAVLMTKLVHELRRTGGRYGLQTMCEGGGQANVTIIERV
ncbi:acetyl-CoA C-acetyltransferase [Thermobifida fusca]|uniref:Acetyl-CoA acetyltransferase n=2 Tax=Thermobifida fusca TaxID=2021 RepID=A0A9P2TCD6_THEFU|nr:MULTISPECIES: acetyl-CoA C-acetyltransferase [Thermobifida]AAZ54291.1 thiolase [Thermobifida fusca YX]EOR72637.1 acetyl-CoA acetyltransferase [Thermobifida fusca TM51]MBO2529842.1 acetyl-CoA C-acyltransferase [Thermobifida sp.]PPS94045.1 acetyl-CoA acetyltransferase [Thermobifida fusca]PZN64580.1 MAG: acetyl-CoA C-acetyltransferase [Thermobifida fusca]